MKAGKSDSIGDCDVACDLLRTADRELLVTVAVLGYRKTRVDGYGTRVCRAAGKCGSIGRAYDGKCGSVTTLSFCTGQISLRYEAQEQIVMAFDLPVTVLNNANAGRRYLMMAIAIDDVLDLMTVDRDDQLGRQSSREKSLSG